MCCRAEWKREVVPDHKVCHCLCITSPLLGSCRILDQRRHQEGNGRYLQIMAHAVYQQNEERKGGTDD